MKLKKTVRECLYLQKKIPDQFNRFLDLFCSEPSGVVMNNHFKLFLLQIMILYPNYIEWRVKSNVFREAYNEGDEYLRKSGFKVFEDYLKDIRYCDDLFFEDLDEIEEAFEEFKNDLANINRTNRFNRIFTKAVKLNKNEVLVNLIWGIIKINSDDVKSLDIQTLVMSMKFYSEVILKELTKIKTKTPTTLNLEINQKKFSIIL